MPYREKKIYSGDILEVEIYPIKTWERKQSRAKKEKLTVPKQQRLNDKNARKHLVRLINANFSNRDMAVHLTYDRENLPGSEKEARKDVANYLRRVKHYIAKEGLEELKYIAVVEYKEPEGKDKGVRIHHHIIMNGGIDRDKIEELWGKGRANADRLKADEYGYEGLARYISKDPKGNKRWTQSRNLKQPKVKVNDFKYSKRKVEDISKYPEDRGMFSALYPGYILNDCKVSVNEYTDGRYMYIRMRRLKD
ncbi:hypothetical protein EUAN_07190 [Andreesenia angusta]|uniref:Replication-associated protein ORF2/G2P domain-containing protein n=1 Tax=Andreesenia angusta TaxID=39480 RepID=A0A1S1V951_9FIRM|nr:hypothetical protein [Andreesenia angusta]OHW62935.1 hypothetical protein EUAN_07190 [Andreesenia angusta]